MKMMRKILLGLVVIVAVTLIGVTSALYWAVKNPESAWRFAQQFLPSDLSMSWQKLDVSLARLSGLNFKFDLEFQGLKIKKTNNPYLEIPLDKLRAVGSVYFWSPVQNVMLDEFELSASDLLRIEYEKSAEQQEKSPYQRAQTIAQTLGDLRQILKFKKFKVEVKTLEMNRSPSPLRISFRAENTLSRANSLRVQTLLQKESPSDIEMHIIGVLDLENYESEQSLFEGVVTIRSDKFKTRQTLRLRARNHEVNLDFQGRAQFQKYVAYPKGQLVVRSKGTDLKVEVPSILGSRGALASFRDLHGNFFLPFEEDQMWSSQPTTYKINVPIALFFIDDDMKPPLEKYCQCRIPEVLNAEVVGKVWMAVLMSKPAQETSLLTARVRVESIKNKLLEGTLEAVLEIRKKEERLSYFPRLQAQAHIQSFRGLRNFLDAKNVLIPAPFDILQGEVHLEAKDPIRVNERGYLFPVSVVTELASKNQKVSLRADIETTLHRDFKEAHVHVRTRIRDLQVELPPLDPLRGRPRLKRDARILISKEKKKIPLRKFKATFSFEMETAAPGRIRLLSKHFNPALPLTLKLSQDSEKIRDGFIEAQPFEIVYLKRRIQVEKLRLFLDSDPQKAFKIDGRLKIPQTEYILFADLSGTVAKPIIDLSSDPYLPDSEIISVLLYDRTSDQLVAADAETAGSVRAAMVDRAIGLFGLWAFASTPIRNFSYNPSTKVYTATLALSDDTTAGIGTTWDQTTNLELRKRVSKRWVLTAEWVPTGEEEDLTRLVLQWEKRF